MCLFIRVLERWWRGGTDRRGRRGVVRCEEGTGTRGDSDPGLDSGRPSQRTRSPSFPGRTPLKRPSGRTGWDRMKRKSR